MAANSLLNLSSLVKSTKRDNEKLLSSTSCMLTEEFSIFTQFFITRSYDVGIIEQGKAKLSEKPSSGKFMDFCVSLLPDFFLFHFLMATQPAHRQMHEIEGESRENVLINMICGCEGWFYDTQWRWGLSGFFFSSSTENRLSQIQCNKTKRNSP